MPHHLSLEGFNEILMLSECIIANRRLSTVLKPINDLLAASSLSLRLRLGCLVWNDIAILRDGSLADPTRSWGRHMAPSSVQYALFVEELSARRLLACWYLE